MFLYTAFMVGLLGGMHCIGMCGPLTLALPIAKKTLPGKALYLLPYHFGRVVTYSMLGSIFALIGKGLNIAGLQQIVSIVLGALMILSVVISALNFGVFHKASYKIGSFVNSRLRPYLKRKNIFSLWVIGLLNGLLPCGLVYMAIAGSLVSDSILEGTLYMTFFGIGTIPLLGTFTLVSHSLGQKFKNVFRKILPVFIVVLGILFILRGLNLGIKYVSPQIDKEEKVVRPCCGSV